MLGVYFYGCARRWTRARLFHPCPATWDPSTTGYDTLSAGDCRISILITSPIYIPSLTLRLEQSKDIVLTDRALDVADDAARGVVHELNTDLDHTTTRTGAAKHFGHLDRLVLLFFHAGWMGAHEAQLSRSCTTGVESSYRAYPYQQDTYARELNRDLLRGGSGVHLGSYGENKLGACVVVPFFVNMPATPARPFTELQFCEVHVTFERGGATCHGSSTPRAGTIHHVRAHERWAWRATRGRPMHRLCASSHPCDRRMAQPLLVHWS